MFCPLRHAWRSLHKYYGNEIALAFCRLIPVWRVELGEEEYQTISMINGKWTCENGWGSAFNGIQDGRDRSYEQNMRNGKYANSNAAGYAVLTKTRWY